MRKVYDFSTFNALYEEDAATAAPKAAAPATPTPPAAPAAAPAAAAPGAPAATEASKLYDKTLGLIITTALNAYSSELTFPAKPYDQNISADITSVKSAGAVEKAAALVKIMEKVKAASSNNGLEGAKEAVDAWVAAGTKATEALSKMVDQYKDKPDELKHINDFVNSRLDAYLKGIQTSSKSNDLKDTVTKLQGEAKKESNFYDGSDYIFEGFLEGKKGMIGDISKQITLVNAKLASLLLTPGMEADVKKLQSEVTQISAAMGALLGKKNSEISKDEIKKAAERLAQIPTEADKSAEAMLKQDTTNKEAAAILVQALGLSEEAKEKEVAYLSKKEEALAKDKAAKEASKVVYDKNKSGEVNSKVSEFQKLVTDKFQGIKSISDLPGFKNMGSSGKFGPATAAVVKALKAGYGLPDVDSPDITAELLAELNKDEEIKESRILSFKGFNGINEAFDSKKAASTLKSSYTPSSSASGGSGVKKSPSGVKTFKEGDKGPEVKAIQNAVSAQVGPEEMGDNNKGIPATFGAKTKEAVIAWQKANGFTGKDADGIVGPATLKKMAEIKNLGSWTATMISKLSGTEVKAFVPAGDKPLTEDEMEKAKEIAISINSAAVGDGTDEEELVDAIKEIKDKRQFDAINKLFSESAGVPASSNPLKKFVPSDFKSIQAIVKGELGINDFEDIKKITNHLKSIGIKASYETLKDDYGYESYKDDSFKVS